MYSRIAGTGCCSASVGIHIRAASLSPLASGTQSVSNSRIWRGKVVTVTVMCSPTADPRPSPAPEIGSQDPAGEGGNAAHPTATGALLRCVENVSIVKVQAPPVSPAVRPLRAGLGPWGAQPLTSPPEPCSVPDRRDDD